jgi:DNA-binding CsgD family transcriptional regulator
MSSTTRTNKQTWSPAPRSSAPADDPGRSRNGTGPDQPNQEERPDRPERPERSKRAKRTRRSASRGKSSADSKRRRTARKTPRAQPLSARDREMFELRASGWTLAQIGERFGITRQRVDEILRDKGGPRAAESVAARRAREAALVRQRSEEILRRWRAGLDAEEIARQLGFTFAAVKEVIDDEASGFDKAARSHALSSRTTRMKYSDRDLIDGLRKAAKIFGHAPSEPEYDSVARDLGAASVQTIIGRLGGWSQAAAAAGLQPNSATRASHRKTWDDEACWTALESVADRLGDPPRYRVYEELALGRPDLPSGATIRKRLGRWTDVALELIARRDRARSGRAGRTRGGRRRPKR